MIDLFFSFKRYTSFSSSLILYCWYYNFFLRLSKKYLHYVLLMKPIILLLTFSKAYISWLVISYFVLLLFIFRDQIRHKHETWITTSLLYFSQLLTYSQTVFPPTVIRRFRSKQCKILLLLLRRRLFTTFIHKSIESTRAVNLFFSIRSKGVYKLPWAFHEIRFFDGKLLASMFEKSTANLILKINLRKGQILWLVFLFVGIPTVKGCLDKVNLFTEH